MGVMLFTVIAVNISLFAGLSLWAWSRWRSEESPRLRMLAGALTVVSVAFVIGAITRLFGVGVQLGWFDGRLGSFLLSEWHLVQSLGATVLALVGIAVIRRYGGSLKSADRVASAVADRLLNGGGLSEFGFTNREIEVLRAIADGHVSDAEIAEILFIAPATAGTHVKNILKKTGVRSRRELALLVASTNI